MGMFDTIRLEEDMVFLCPSCKKEIRDIQTKAFDNTLNTFSIGHIVGPVDLNCIIQEQIWCSDCKDAVGKLYLVVRFGILVSVTPDADVAAVDYKKNAQLDPKLFIPLYREVQNLRKKVHDAYLYFRYIVDQLDKNEKLEAFATPKMKKLAQLDPDDPKSVASAIYRVMEEVL